MKIPSDGELLDRKYRIEGKLGAGGFAIVMHATTLSTGRPVAVKFLRPSPNGYEDKSTARFRREMRVIAQLQSPHTLTLFDYGRTDDGVLYMVCEYLEGEDLLQLLNRRGRLQEHEAIWILHQALQSLAEAHEFGVLHRDLKPDNIRVFEYGNDPLRVKLLDFGISKPLDTTDARLTGTGNIIGTPRYMAPEQMYGEDLTPATDIYGLGLVACEMLAGREITTFSGGPRTIQLGQDTGVSEPLRRIINHMVALEAHDRYQDARQVMADLRALMPGSSSGSQPVQPSAAPVPVRPELPRAAPTIDERPGGLGRGSVHLGLGAAAFVVVGTAAWLMYSTTEQEPVRESRDVTPALIKRSLTVTPIESPPPQDAGTVAADRGTALDLNLTSGGCGKAPPFTGTGNLQQVFGLSHKNRMVHIPRDYDPYRQHAVIILLREAGQPREHMINAGFGRLADRENLVLIAPGGGDASIDLGNIQGKLWDKRGDIEELKGIWDFMRGELCLDPTQVFAVGDVSGGQAVERLPCEWPITAMATNGYNASSQDTRCEHQQAVPYLQLLFTQDQYNPRRGGRNVTGVEKRSWDEGVERWQKFNSCNDNRRVERSKHGSCAYYTCEAPFVQCRIEGGRPWPGTAPPPWELVNGLRGGQPSEFESVERIWSFFSSVPPLDPPGVE